MTVGAVAAALLALANLIAVIAGWDGGTDADAGQALAGSLLVTAVVCVVAVGMWKSKYWAVLGMQTLLAITIVICSLALDHGDERRRGARAHGHDRGRRHALLVPRQGDGTHPDARATGCLAPIGRLIAPCRRASTTAS